MRSRPVSVTGQCRATRPPRLRSPAARLRWLLAALALVAGHASAQLMVHPTRIVFDDNQRAAQLEVINNSTETATYRLSLVNRRMSEDGQFIPVDEPQPGEQFADTMLRYSPRHITLAPGTSQVVRILLRRPSDLAAGEYRSHLLFAKQAEAMRPDTGATAQARESIDIALNALIGVSIPVIVREGETRADVSIAKLALEAHAGSPVAALELHRSGNRSAYGDLVASFTPRGGTARIVGRAGGVAVYAPNAMRRVRLRLEPPPGLVLANGTLTVGYREQGGAVLAESSLPIP
jgi:hypothetical protein